MRLIDADDVERSIMESDGMCDDCAYDFIAIINRQKTVYPVKHGHWKSKRQSPFTGLWMAECSVCNTCDVYMDWKYCPNCGAKMDKEIEE